MTMPLTPMTPHGRSPPTRSLRTWRHSFPMALPGARPRLPTRSKVRWSMGLDVRAGMGREGVAGEGEGQRWWLRYSSPSSKARPPHPLIPRLSIPALSGVGEVASRMTELASALKLPALSRQSSLSPHSLVAEFYLLVPKAALHLSLPSLWACACPCPSPRQVLWMRMAVAHLSGMSSRSSPRPSAMAIPGRWPVTTTTATRRILSS